MAWGPLLIHEPLVASLRQGVSIYFLALQKPWESWLKERKAYLGWQFQKFMSVITLLLVTCDGAENSLPGNSAGADLQEAERAQQLYNGPSSQTH